MKSPVLFDLDLYKKRLNYYTQLKADEEAKLARAGLKASRKARPLDKWIEIYAERVKKLERQAARLGAKAEQPHALQ